MNQSGSAKNAWGMSAIKQNDILIISIEYTVHLESADDFQKEIDRFLEESITKFVLNMEKCKYISSITLAAVINLKKKLHSLNGDIKLARVNELIRKLFEKTNVFKILEIYDTVEDAIASFKKVS